MTETLTQPSLYIPHGGGPCFFTDDPQGKWRGMEAYLRGLSATLLERPKAILLVSAHWETDGFTFTGAAKPELVYDYHGFPPHTYALRYDAPGAPVLARQAVELLLNAGFTGSIDPDRGLDHGVFVPLKVAFPDANIPVVEMSLDRSLDPALHLAAGRALAPLRAKGVLVMGSGMSFHNMGGYGNPQSTKPSQAFDHWLTSAIAKLPAERDALLAEWANAPAARFSHPREEHLIPLMVAAGASKNAGRSNFGELVLETAISGYSFA